MSLSVNNQSARYYRRPAGTKSPQPPLPVQKTAAGSMHSGKALGESADAIGISTAQRIIENDNGVYGVGFSGRSILNSGLSAAGLPTAMTAGIFGMGSEVSGLALHPEPADDGVSR